MLPFHTKMISAQLLWGSVLLIGVHHKYAKNSHFKNFESALYLTSVSMPDLMINETTEQYQFGSVFLYHDAFGLICSKELVQNCKGVVPIHRRYIM